MRRYSDPVEVRSGSRLGAVQGTAPRRAAGSVHGTVEVDALVDGGGDGREAVDVAGPEAFIWQGRLYVVRRVLAHWRERRTVWAARRTSEGTRGARTRHGYPSVTRVSGNGRPPRSARRAPKF